MANVQLENGYIAIVLDLYVEIARADFTSLERNVIDAVIVFTYGIGKTKAEITVEDIRYLLGAPKKLRTDRIAAVLVKLIEQKVVFRQELVNGKQLLGIQKDYDKWVSSDKMSPLINKLYINTVTIYSGDKMSPPERLLAYAQRKSNFRYSLGSYKAELKMAKLLYIEALQKTRVPLQALFLLKDFIDLDEWMQANVKMQFTYMYSRFGAWSAQVPKLKPREVREDEEAMDCRYRYNVRLKQWEKA